MKTLFAEHYKKDLNPLNRTNNSSILELIPPELIVHILSFLKVKGLNSIQEVNKFFYYFTKLNDEYLWKSKVVHSKLYTPIQLYSIFSAGKIICKKLIV